MEIHSTAMVDPSARLAPDVTVGAHAFIGPEVELGPGCVIGHHVNIERNTTLGEKCRIWPFVSLGSDPQDLKYADEPTLLEIGARTRIREFVTVNRGTEQGGGLTRVGDDCLLMAYSHVAHDCKVGNGVVMANAATLAGHVTLEDRCSLGGLSAVHQFTRIGAFCFLGGLSGVDRDLPPYTLCDGNRAKTHGLNIVGLKRAGFAAETIDSLKLAYRLIFRTRTPLKQALAEARAEAPDCPELRHFLEFIETSQRGVAR